MLEKQNKHNHSQRTSITKTMKTSHIIITLASMFVLSGIAIANSQNIISLTGKGAEEFEQITNTVSNDDGDNLSIEKRKPSPAKPTILNNSNQVPSMEADFNYLKFDVNKYITEGVEAEITELPESSFDYLKFDVNTFTESNPVSIDELPSNEFEYLHFNVDHFYTPGFSSKGDLGEMPETE